MNELKNYLFRMRWFLVSVAALTLMTHGSVLFTQRFGIDTDAIMNGIHNYDLIGRQGLIWLAKLLGLDLNWFNLYYAQVLTVLLLFLSPVAFACLFRLTVGEEKGEGAALLVLSVSYIVSPFWVSQIYFLNQSAQILLACILTAAAIVLTENARKDLRHRWYFLFFALLLMQATFSCYQVLIMIYITGVCTVFLLYSLRHGPSFRQQFGWIGFHAGIFTAGFLIDMAISNLFFMEGGHYLSEQIAWTRVTVPEGLRRCMEAIVLSLKNTPPYYTGLYGVFCLLFLALLLCHLTVRRAMKVPADNLSECPPAFGKGSCILTMLSALFLCGSPYVFVFLYGGELLDRMQLVMPLSQGCVLYLTVLLLTYAQPLQGRIFSAVKKGLLLLLVLAVCKDTLSHLSFCHRFYYTDEWVFQYTSRIAEEICQEIRTVQYDNATGKLPESARDNILFLGYPVIPYNNTCLGGHVIGHSAFNYDLTVRQPARERILLFLQNMGYPVSARFTEEETVVFRQYFESVFADTIDSMPSYPSPGYVQWISDKESGQGYLVIKLGDDWRRQASGDE